LLENLIGVIDLAATRASQIAAKKRLEHEHQRVAFTAGQLLANDVGADARLLQKGNRHA